MVVGEVHGCRGCVWLQGACVVVGGVHGCRGHVWLRGVCVVAGGVHVRGIRRDTVNTHHTGMHSCFTFYLHLKQRCVSQQIKV